MERTYGVGGKQMSQVTPLYLCLYAREFPAQALLRLRPEMRGKPLVVMEGQAPLERVCSFNQKARALGAQRGMTRVEIDTIPTVVSLARSDKQESSARLAALECAGCFSPRIEDLRRDAVFSCAIDIGGTERLFGSPETLAKDLLARIRSLGIAAVAAVSANFHAALCVARGFRSGNSLVVVPAGQEARLLSSLPLFVLGLSERHAETFSLWGIRTLGMLASLPEEPLIARIGQEGRRLRQMALGVHPHLFQPIEPTFKLEEHIDLDFPEENLQSLLFGLNLMLEQLILRAQNRILALASLTTTLMLDGGTAHVCTVKPTLPTSDRQLLLKLVQLDLETHPPSAAILSVTLTAEPGSTSKVQLGLFSPQLPEAARLDITLARIRAIVGEDHVGRPVLKDTNRHNDFGIEPFTVPKSRPSMVEAKNYRTAMRQLRPAENLSVGFRGGQPQSFYFRGNRYEIERAYGPWMASGEWWSDSSWNVEEWDFIARCGEERLCCFVYRDVKQGQWMMAGVYD